MSSMAIKDFTKDFGRNQGSVTLQWEKGREGSSGYYSVSRCWKNEGEFIWRGYVGEPYISTDLKRATATYNRRRRQLEKAAALHETF